MHRTLSLLCLIVVMAGCQAAPPTAVPITDTPTPSPTATDTPIPTATLTLQEQQREVIRAIYPDYNRFGDVCEWEQVECDDQGHITYLNLGDYSLGTLAPEIGQLSYLKELQLY